MYYLLLGDKENKFKKKQHNIISTGESSCSKDSCHQMPSLHFLFRDNPWYLTWHLAMCGRWYFPASLLAEVNGFKRRYYYHYHTLKAPLFEDDIVINLGGGDNKNNKQKH